MTLRIFPLLFILILMSIGCNRMKPDEFIRQVNEDNGPFNSVKEFQANNLKLSCLYRPAEFNALMELNPASDFDNQFELAMEEQEGSLRFDFRISCLDPSYDIIKDTLPADLYLERIEYLTGEMASDFSLVLGSDTLAPTFFHYERTYNMTPFNNFLLGFELPREQVQKDIQILYDDKLFGIGRVQFDYKINTINQKYPIDL